MHTEDVWADIPEREDGCYCIEEAWPLVYPCPLHTRSTYVEPEPQPFDGEPDPDAPF